MTGGVRAGFVWAGATLSLSLPGPRWRARLTDLLGLPAADLPEQPCEIAVRDGTHLRSFETDLTFPTPRDLLVWLALTIVDVLAEKARAFLIHAASLRLGEGIVLLSGAPYSGKSTLALHAYRRGMALLGDDVVRLDLQTLRAEAVPRPLRERMALTEVADQSADPLALGLPLAGVLDGEGCRLHPRSILGEPTTESGLRIGSVYFLRRHSGPGLRSATPTSFESVGLFLAHARVWAPQSFSALPRIAAMLKGCDRTILSVGDGEVGAALDLIVRRHGGATA